MRRLFLLVLAMITAACGSVADSTPVGINLKAKSSEVRSGVIADEKGISTESGNPYKVFIDAAKARLGGRDPSSIKLSNMTLTLGAGTTGVTALSDVFSGQVDVLFVVEDTNNTFPAGTFSRPSGAGPVGSSSIGFTFSQLGGLDRTNFLAGKFKVGIRGPATAGFSARDADAKLQVTFSFSAFE